MAETVMAGNIIQANELRLIREAMGLSQEELGMAMGLAKGSGARLIRRAEADDIDLSPMAAQCVRYLYALHLIRRASDGLKPSGPLADIEDALCVLPEFMRP